jgi:hypothetical protein
MGAAFSIFASTPWALAAIEDEAAKYFAAGLTHPKAFRLSGR